MNQPLEFQWDVFLSHATADKDFVRPIARRLSEDGITLWIDEESLAPGDHVLGEIEAGIQRSQILVFFASHASIGSAWASLERQSAMFRDPLNKARRFVTVRIDDIVLPDVLKGFKYIDWKSLGDEVAYKMLLSVCPVRTSGPPKSVIFQHVFTPGAPPSRPDLLVGRKDQLQDLRIFFYRPASIQSSLGPAAWGKLHL